MPSSLERSVNRASFCCRKTAACNRDQLLDFSVPELVRSQSTFSTDLEVLQNCPGLTLCSSAGLAGERSAVMGLTTCMLCVQIYCVDLPTLLNPERGGSGPKIFWAPTWGSGSMLPQEILKISVLRLAENAFPTF